MIRVASMVFCLSIRCSLSLRRRVNYLRKGILFFLEVSSTISFSSSPIISFFFFYFSSLNLYLIEEMELSSSVVKESDYFLILAK